MHEHEHDHVHQHADGQSHSHPHTHDHPHGAAAAMSPEETLALLGYMLDHNRHHADELHDICHALEDNGKADAAAKLSEALHYFDHCNDALAEAVELAKGE